MSLEQQISELNNSIKALVVAIGSAFAAGQMATATLADVGTQSTTDKPAKDTKAEKPAKAETKKADDKPTTAEVTWKDTLAKILEVSKSDKPGCGREGVTTLMKKFKADAKKVPELEALNKHAEILAAATALLEGTAAADDADDLGI